MLLGFRLGWLFIFQIDSIEYNLLTRSEIPESSVYYQHQNKRKMDENKVVETLKRCANFKAKRNPNGVLTGYGSISHFPKCYDMTPAEYSIHYEKCKKELEELPWENVVVLPRMPIENEYPAEDGEYITMLDANEHEVIVNTFKNGSWLLYNRTHVKWWMPLTQTMIEELFVY